jgi:Flp pilus assembly protein TadB
MGAAVYFMLIPIIRDIFERDELDQDTWNRQHVRWTRLRDSSGLFRSAERWIRAIAKIVQRRLPWIVESKCASTRLGQLLQTTQRLVLGNPTSLNNAVRIRTHDQPWASEEVVATAILLGLWGGAFSVIVLLNLFTWPWLVVIGSSVSIGCYRFWIIRFVKEAQQRRQAVRHLLPHAIDAIAMIMSSGGTFYAGMEVVTADFPSHPLSQELKRLRNNLERGQSMRDALQDAAQTICLPEFDEMVRVLSRVHGHGIPGAENFRRLAKQLRITHLRHMEEGVGRAEASMSLPTLLVLVACMLVCCAPFLLGIMENEVLK